MGRLGRVWIGVAFFVCALVIIPESAGMFARMTDSELVDRSEVVVSGTLIGQSSIRLDHRDFRLGVIRVDAVYKGDSAHSLLFLVLPGAGRPLSSTDLDYKVGQSGLWFLRPYNVTDRGLYLADHPQRFIPADHSAPQIEMLKRLPARP